MRELFVSLPAPAIIATAAIAGLQNGATASTAMPSRAASGRGIQAASQENPPDISFTTTMISHTAIDVAPGGLSPGDGYVLAGRRHAPPSSRQAAANP